MSDETVSKIEILKEIPFTGSGDTLTNRLRKVTLRGFANVKIYEDSEFEWVKFSPEDIQNKLYTPQPGVYRDYLHRIDILNELFKEQDINILNLDRAYDFVAISNSGKETEWTILPPIIERFFIDRTNEGFFDYTPLIGDELKELLSKENLILNPELTKLKHLNDNGIYDLINDGSHRVHYGFENGGINVLRISGMKRGFPYYAAPQRYDAVQVYNERTRSDIDKKIHILQEPAHKSLYRLFPSGGIKSGDVRNIPKN
jgi:hypothetical protein